VGKGKEPEADNVGRSVYAALSLLDSVITFRETLTLQEKRLELARRNWLEPGKNGGPRISEADLIAVELGLAQRQNAIIETRYQLLLAERGLERLTGLSDSGETEFRWESREAGWVVDPAASPKRTGTSGWRSWKRRRKNWPSGSTPPETGSTRASPSPYRPGIRPEGTIQGISALLCRPVRR
jgi:hypothetical protein